MPTATNGYDRVRIHYEVHGSGPALLMLHGGGSSLERWHELGYVKALSQSFRLVLVDARGHGQSDRPHNADAYRYERWVSDLVAVLDHAGIERAHFFGYSLGGLVGFRIPLFAPDRFHSLIIGGAHPCAQFDFFNQQYELFKDGLNGYLEQRERSGSPVDDSERADLERADLNVYAMAGLALRNEPSALDGLTDVAPPMLLFVGEHDTTDDVQEKLERSIDRIPDAALLVIAGCGHRDLLQERDLITPFMLAFLSSLDCQTA